MKRALIIGVTGQDGAYLSRALLVRGIEVYGTSRTPKTSEATGLSKLRVKLSVNLLFLDTLDFNSTCALIEAVEPDMVFNLGGQSSVGQSFIEPAATFHSIAAATANLLEALRIVRPEARFYNAGSSECFGDRLGLASNAETPMRPLSPYASSKAAASMLVKTYRDSYSLFCVTGYLFNHESYFRSERFVVAKIINAALRISKGSGETLNLGDMSIRRDWGWAPEFVEAMIRMLEQENPVDYVVATGNSMSIEQLVSYAFEAFDLDWRAHVRSDSSLSRPNELKASVGDPRPAERGLGWRAQTHGQDLVKLLCSELTENSN